MGSANLPPGRELDKQVSMAIFGRADGAEYDDDGNWICEPFSSDIAAAWQVVEKLELSVIRYAALYYVGSANLHFTQSEVGDGYVEDFNNGMGLDEIDCAKGYASAPHAICLAALKLQDNKG